MAPADRIGWGSSGVMANLGTGPAPGKRAGELSGMGPAPG